MTADCKCPKCYKNQLMNLPERLPGQTVCPNCGALIRLDVVLIPQRARPIQPSREAMLKVAA